MIGTEKLQSQKSAFLRTALALSCQSTACITGRAKVARMIAIAVVSNPSYLQCSQSGPSAALSMIGNSTAIDLGSMHLQ